MVSTGVVIDSGVYADAMISFPRLTFSLAARSCVAKLDPRVCLCASGSGRQVKQFSSLPLLMHDSVHTTYITLHPIINFETI